MAVIKWIKNVFEGKKKVSDERRLYKKIDDQLIFVHSEPLTLGVEFELALLDNKTLKPAHMGPEIIAEINSPQVKKELFEHMVEVTSVVGANVHETEAQMKEAIDKLAGVAHRKNALITGTGRPPTIMLADARRIPDERYARLYNERRILNERFGTLGMHIHVGMADSEQCIRYHNFFMHFIPHMIALSASSPFEDGVETGLASIRPTIAESLPVAGMPYSFHNWQEYTNLVRAIFRAGSIENMKDLWWDMRPSPRYGTLELRICDQPASLDEGMAIAAFVHGLALWFQEHQDWLDEIPRPTSWRVRENKWRAMRYGLEAELVMNNLGETKPMRESINLWMERLEPFFERYNYQKYWDMLENILAKGNSSQRQQRLWAATKDQETVARFNCDEFALGKPLWDRVETVEKEASEPLFHKAAG